MSEQEIVYCAECGLPCPIPRVSNGHGTFHNACFEVAEAKGFPDKRDATIARLQAELGAARRVVVAAKAYREAEKARNLSRNQPGTRMASSDTVDDLRDTRALLDAALSAKEAKGE